MSQLVLPGGAILASAATRVLFVRLYRQFIERRHMIDHTFRGRPSLFSLL